MKRCVTFIISFQELLQKDIFTKEKLKALQRIVFSSNMKYSLIFIVSKLKDVKAVIPFAE
jgi:hypothetical protein